MNIYEVRINSDDDLNHVTCQIKNQNNAEFFEQVWAKMDEDEDFERILLHELRGWRGSEDSWSWKLTIVDGYS